MGSTPILRRERHVHVPLRCAFVLASLLTVGSGIAVGCSGYDKPDLTADELTAFGEQQGFFDAGAAYAWDKKCEKGGEPGQGDLCTRDCILEEDCNSNTGRRVCTCEGGVYLQCVCQPPEGWPYDDSPTPTAPYCDRLTGAPDPDQLGSDRCTTPGLQCVGEKDPTKACTCEAIPNGGGLGNWLCGDTAVQMPPPGSPACEDFGSGQRSILNGDPCPTLWEICVARDYYLESTTPRGCACLIRPDGRQLWTCGSTNRWYRPE